MIIQTTKKLTLYAPVWKQISAITIWNLTATEYLVLKYFI